MKSEKPVLVTNMLMNRIQRQRQSIGHRGNLCIGETYLKVLFSAGIVASCIGIFILAALYEGLKVLREILKRRYSYVVSVDLSETKTYGTGPGQTTVITESKGHLPRLDYCVVTQLKLRNSSLFPTFWGLLHYRLQVQYISDRNLHV